MSENEGRDLSLVVATALSASAVMAAKAILGPTFNEMGEDLKKLYVSGRDKLIGAAYRKLPDPNDGKKANLRVVRDAFWSGAFTDDEICAEYFGGVLATSRSEDGKDDSNIQFLATIKSMSSSQLRLHYVIYTRLNQILCQSSDRINVADQDELNRKKVYFSTEELCYLGVRTDTDFNVLHRLGLLNSYRSHHEYIKGDVAQFVVREPNGIYSRSMAFSYSFVGPTIYGVLLLAVAHNRIGERNKWIVFDRERFGIFEGIALPELFAPTLDQLREQWISTIKKAKAANKLPWTRGD